MRLVTLLAAATAALVVTGCGAGATPSAKPHAAARELFVAQGCGKCHALADAHARGGSGPDFDVSERLNRRQIMTGIVEGANGMPSYEHKLTRTQRLELADYLLAVAWHKASSMAAPPMRAR